METTVKKAISTNPYTVYSGVAAEDLAKDSIILQVICPELLPNTAFGTVGAGITKGTVNLKDRDGNAVSSQITSANHLVATWEGASNQRYAPLVRKGEPVEVYKTGNQDKYLWRIAGRGREFRTTDRLHFEVAATDPSKPGVAKDDTNTYSAYLDSENKKIGMKTSAANGEVTAFSMEADLAEGTFHLSDNSKDPGNRIFLDTGTKSGTPVFQVNLSSGITLKFEGDNAFMKIPGKFEIDVTERFVINSPIMVFNLEKTGSFIINAMNVAVNTAKDVVITAGGVFGLNTASSKISGLLIAAAVRSANVVKAPAGSNYTPVSIARPQEDPVKDASNTSDTDASGIPYKTT